MRQETRCMKVICDGCGETFATDEGFVCYADDPDGGLIWEVAQSSEWIEFSGRCYCPSCWSYDLNDNIVTKDGHKFDGETHEEIKEDEK